MNASVKAAVQPTKSENLKVALSRKWVVDTRKTGKVYASVADALLALGIKTYATLVKNPYIVVLDK